MISQLETPTNTMQTNDRYNFKNKNLNNYNNRNTNTFNNNNYNNLNHDALKITYYNINNNNKNDILQETEIIDYSKPPKKNAFDYNQMIDNHNPLDYSNSAKNNHKKIKYSTIQQRKKKMHLNNFSVDEDIGDDYVRKIFLFLIFSLYFIHFLNLIL